MPSGQTHDRITLWSLPFVAAGSFLSTHNSNITLLVAAGFMFGGLMFGPDLDIYSRQFQRWGFLRWIWLPYQKSLRHRSFLSHGPIIGTILRVVYLLSLLIVLAMLFLILASRLASVTLNWQDLGINLGRSLAAHYGGFVALLIGLEAGAMSHSLSDWGNSTYKRVQKQGLSGLLNHGKIKKRKVVRNRRPSKKR